MKNITVVLMLVLAMVFAPIMSSAETKGFYREDFQLTPTTKVTSVIQIYGERWYGGATQGFQALVQMVPSVKMTREKIRLEWYRQKGKCPNEDQITAVEKGWNETMIWLQEKGAMEEMVTIFSHFNLPLDAPGPKVLAAIVKVVSDVGVAAIGGYFFKAAFAALRPDNYNSNTTQTGAGSGPVTTTSHSNSEVNDSGNSTNRVNAEANLTNINKIKVNSEANITNPSGCGHPDHGKRGHVCKK